MNITRIALTLLASISLSFGAEEWERLAVQADKYLYEDQDLNKAIEAYTKAIALQPQNPALYANRGNAFSYQKNLDKAVSDYDTSIKMAVERLGSDKAKELCYFYYNKAYAYDRVDRHADAIPYYERVVSIDDTYPDAHGHLAWILATSHDPTLRDPKRAIQLATHELAGVGGKDAGVMDTLAAAHAATGNFKDAISWQQKAIGIVESKSEKKEFSERLRLYESNSPYIQVHATTNPSIDIGSEGLATLQCPPTFHVEQESNDTVFLMPRKQDSDGPVSMRLTCLRDARKEGVTSDKVKLFLKSANETDILHEEGENLYSTRNEKGADAQGTKWIYNSYLIYADGLLVTATVQTMDGREKEPQCDELEKALPEIIRSIDRKDG